MSYQSNHPGRENEIDELRRMTDGLAKHNYELKILILRYGDDDIKRRLEKLMKKHNTPKNNNDAARLQSEAVV